MENLCTYVCVSTCGRECCLPFPFVKNCSKENERIPYFPFNSVGFTLKFPKYNAEKKKKTFCRRTKIIQCLCQNREFHKLIQKLEFRIVCF